MIDDTAWMPHGYCIQWAPGVVWPMVVGNALIALAYFVIPIKLIRLHRARPDLMPGWFSTAFASFVLLCGVSHAFAIVTLWIAVYRAEAWWAVATAINSWAVVALLFVARRHVLALPRAADLAEARRQLAAAEEHAEQCLARAERLAAQLEEREGLA